MGATRYCVRFTLITLDFYRSAQPSELNFSFLEKLELRTVIWVGAERPPEILYVTKRVTISLTD